MQAHTLYHLATEVLTSICVSDITLTHDMTQVQTSINQILPPTQILSAFFYDIKKLRVQTTMEVFDPYVEGQVLKPWLVRTATRK